MWRIGNRVPSVQQIPESSKLYVGCYVSDHWAHWFVTDSLTEDWFNLKIKNSLVSSRVDYFSYEIFIDNKQVYETINWSPKVFYNVQAEFGRIRDGDYLLADGSYRNLQVISKKIGFHFTVQSFVENADVFCENPVSVRFSLD